MGGNGDHHYVGVKGDLCPWSSVLIVTKKVGYKLIENIGAHVLLLNFYSWHFFFILYNFFFEFVQKLSGKTSLKGWKIDPHFPHVDIFACTTSQTHCWGNWGPFVTLISPLIYQVKLWYHFKVGVKKGQSWGNLGSGLLILNYPITDPHFPIIDSKSPQLILNYPTFLQWENIQRDVSYSGMFWKYIIIYIWRPRMKCSDIYKEHSVCIRFNNPWKKWVTYAFLTQIYMYAYISNMINYPVILHISSI